MVGALALCLGFGASATTYKIKTIYSVRDRACFEDGCRYVPYNAWCWLSGTGKTMCSGQEVPIYLTNPDTSANINYLTVRQQGVFPLKCTLGDGQQRNGEMAVTGYVKMGDTKSGLTIERNTGTAHSIEKDASPISIKDFNRTWLTSFLPTYVTCPAGLGEFDASVYQELRATLPDAGKTKIHGRDVYLIYEPVGAVTRVQLQPASFKLTGPVGKYIVVQTRISVDVEDSSKISVEWPSADMVEYENGGRWTDKLVNELTVTGGLAYRDQKIRLRSATPRSKTISIPVTVTVD